MPVRNALEEISTLSAPSRVGLIFFANFVEVLCVLYVYRS